MRKIAERLLHFVLNMLLGCFPGERLRRVVIQDGTIKLFDIKLDADSIGLPPGFKGSTCILVARLVRHAAR